MDHNCQYQDKIIEMYTDIKWIRGDIQRRNGVFDNHVVTSEDFRTKVVKNASGVFWLKWVVGFLMLLVVYLIRLR